MRNSKASLVVGLVLVVAAGGFAVVRFAPCAFASSEPPFDGFIASVERWLEVVPPFPSTSDRTARANDRTLLLDLLVRPVPADGVTGASPHRLAIHDSFIGDIEDAMRDGSDVFLAFTAEGLAREEVSFVIARRPDGTHEFLGGCWLKSGSAWLRELLGDRYDSATRRIIGLTDRDAIYAVLANVRQATGHQLVGYQDRPDLGSFSRTGTLIVRGPCLAIRTDVGDLVPILDESYYLARDDRGFLLMSGLNRVGRLGELELAGREMSREDARAVTDVESLRRCPGKLILVG